MRAKRDPPEIFGVSLLDLLCSGLGAVALLVVLLGFKTAGEVKTEEQTLSVAKQELEQRKESEGLTAKEREIAAIELEAKTEARKDTTQATALIPLDTAKRIVVLLDVSGSMANYLPEDEPTDREWLRSASRKWRDTLLLTMGLLLSSKQLESFQILPIRAADQTCGQNGADGMPLYVGQTSAPDRWLAREQILEVTNWLTQKIVPCGAADHFTSFRAAESWIFRDSTNDPPDTLFIVTDGLPNRGPCDSDTLIAWSKVDWANPEQALQAIKNADDRREVRRLGKNGCLDSQDGWVSPASKRSRAKAVLERLSLLRADRVKKGQSWPKIHVVSVYWPEDAELGTFALSLASLGQGVSIFPGIRWDMAPVGAAP